MRNYCKNCKGKFWEKIGKITERFPGIFNKTRKNLEGI